MVLLGPFSAKLGKPSNPINHLTKTYSKDDHTRYLCDADVYSFFNKTYEHAHIGYYFRVTSKLVDTITNPGT